MKPGMESEWGEMEGRLEGPRGGPLQGRLLRWRDPADEVNTYARAAYQMIFAQWCSQGKLAATFGRRRGGSRAMGSDAFKARSWPSGGASLVDPALPGDDRNDFGCVVEKSLEVLNSNFASPPSRFRDQLALRAADLARRHGALAGTRPRPWW